MIREAVDTSVAVAALVGRHEAHDAARGVLERALVAERLILPAPTLIEAYAVITRLPSPHRLVTRMRPRCCARPLWVKARSPLMVEKSGN